MRGCHVLTQVALLSRLGLGLVDDLLLLQKEVRFSLTPESTWGCEERCVPAVWVVSAGRSGSTTVLEMLNQIPGYDIMGENQNMWAPLLRLFQKRQIASKNYRQNAEDMTYRHSLQRNMSELLCAYQLRVLGELNPSNARAIGFKEIRWDFEGDLRDLELLMEVFPCSVALLSYRRDLEAEWESRLSSIGEFPEENLRIATAAMLRFHARQPAKRSFLMPLEEFSVDLFNQMLHFLGENCTFNEVLHDNSGSGGSTFGAFSCG
ncbi:unnamed protein product [Effrenium voratum]|uniref:Sulfotransferase n=1 Tax=Effrenium voratum TaxID=2562239 RepID=A0AA36JP44_9DINO|nr:unnamed protein product [Effrenium voratum]